MYILLGNEYIIKNIYYLLILKIIYIIVENDLYTYTHEIKFEK